MREQYTVVHFTYNDGYDPVEEFLESLKNTNQWEIIMSTIARLENIGLLLCSTKSAKKFDLTNKLYELTKGDYRVVFYADGNKFVLLHGFSKFCGKTLRKEKKAIYDRLVKYKEQRR